MTPPSRDRPSHAMRFAIRVLSRETKLGDDLEAYRAAYDGRDYPLPAPVPKALRVVARVGRRSVDGFDVYTVTPKATPSDWHILYLHGGAYVDAMLREHWEIVLNLIRYTGATITVPCYPLAPEHTHEVGNAFVERVYRELLAERPAQKVVLMGDSAGGGMCLAQAMRHRDRGLPSAGRLVVFAPWVDPRMVHPDMPGLAPGDPIQSLASAPIAATWWAGGDDVTHPQVSPLFGELGGLPPVDLYLGTADLLLPDVRLMADKLRGAGVEATLVEYPGAIHVYVGATFTPEARDTYHRIATTLGTAPRRVHAGARLVTWPAAALARQLASRLRHGPSAARGPRPTGDHGLG